MVTPKDKTKEDQTQNLMDLFPSPIFLPGEDETQFDDLRHAVFQRFQPANAYQIWLVEETVRKMWENTRHCQLRDSALITAIRNEAAEIFVTGKVGQISGFGFDTAAEQFGKDLVSPDPDVRTAAIDKLISLGITPGEVAAAAWMTIATEHETHNRRSLELIACIRKLSDDIGVLQAAQHGANTAPGDTS